MRAASGASSRAEPGRSSQAPGAAGFSPKHRLGSCLDSLPPLGRPLRSPFLTTARAIFLQPTSERSLPALKPPMAPLCPRRMSQLCIPTPFTCGLAGLPASSQPRTFSPTAPRGSAPPPAPGKDAPVTLCPPRRPPPPPSTSHPARPCLGAGPGCHSPLNLHCTAGHAGETGKQPTSNQRSLPTLPAPICPDSCSPL